MSRRIDKKRQKLSAAAQSVQTVPCKAAPCEATPCEAAPCEAAPAVNVSFYIQYQNAEYLESEITAKVIEQCKAEGASDAELADLSIYLKPEDKKAYYAYNGKNGAVAL